MREESILIVLEPNLANKKMKLGWVFLTILNISSNLYLYFDQFWLHLLYWLWLCWWYDITDLSTTLHKRWAIHCNLFYCIYMLLNVSFRHNSELNTIWTLVVFNLFERSQLEHDCVKCVGEDDDLFDYRMIPTRFQQWFGQCILATTMLDGQALNEQPRWSMTRVCGGQEGVSSFPFHCFHFLSKLNKKLEQNELFSVIPQAVSLECTHQELSFGWSHL